ARTAATRSQPPAASPGSAVRFRWGARSPTPSESSRWTTSKACVYLSTAKRSARPTRMGMVVLPTLTSFVDNQISINTANVPLEFSFPESMRVVSPAYRGGAVIDFHAKRLQAVMGTLKIRSGAEVKPAEFFQATLAVDGR